MLQFLSVLGNYKKAIAVVSSIIGLAVAAYQLHDHVYTNGYKAAETKMQAEYAAKVEQMQQEYRKDVEDALKKQATEYQSEIDRMAAEKEIVVKTETVKEYVDKIVRVEVPAECDPVIDDVIRMLDSATGIIHTASNGSAGGEDPD